MSEETIPVEGGEVSPLDSLSFTEFERYRETGEMPASEPVAADEVEDEQKEAPESDPVKDEEQEGEDAAEKPAKKGGFQRRIDKLTREKHELAQRVAALEQGKPAQAAQPKPEAAGKPTAETFDTYEDYVEALAEYKLDQRFEAQRQQAETERRDREAEGVRSQWAARADATRAKFADYDDVLEAADTVPVTATIQQALLESEVGPELAYMLAKAPAELARIAKLSPVGQAREIGKLEAKLSPSSQQKPKASTAPAPPKPVTGGKGSVDLSDPTVEYSAWEQARNNQLRGR